MIIRAFDYFGWLSSAPWLFTADGTVIGSLTYGKLAARTSS